MYEFGNIWRRGLKGGEGRAPTTIEDYVVAEGGIRSHVDPPVTVVLDTFGFRVAFRGWCDGYVRKFCNGGGAHQRNCNKEL